MKEFSEVYNCDSITLNVTNACNLECSYCFEKDKNELVMSPEDAVKILDMAYNEPKDKDSIFMVNIFGGEPLIAWDTIEAVTNRIKEKKYSARVGITTNLTLLTDHMIDVIDENEIYLLVSIDGIKSVHDKNRCNSYDIVKENIGKLIDRDLFYLIEARMTVTPDDIGLLFDGVQEIVNMGVNNVTPCLVTDQEWNKEQLNELKNQVDKIFDYYISILNDETNKRNISIKMIDEYIINVLNPYYKDMSMCAIGTNKWCTIGANGDVLPCHQYHTDSTLKESEKIGNIFTGIDETKLLDVPMRSTFEREECKDCIGISMCKSGCPAQNVRCNGDFHTPTNSYCDTVRILTEAAKVNQEKILNSVNIRPRGLNALKINLRIKKYFDEVLCVADITNFDFPIILSNFINLLDENKEILLPSFEMYFTQKLLPIYVLAGGVQNGNLCK